MAFTAREQLRDDSGPTSVPDEDASCYTNNAEAQSHGVVDGIPDGIDSDPADADAQGCVQSFDGVGPLDDDKRWVDPVDKTSDLDYLDAQSGSGPPPAWAGQSASPVPPR